METSGKDRVIFQFCKYILYITSGKKELKFGLSEILLTMTIVFVFFLNWVI